MAWGDKIKMRLISLITPSFKDESTEGFDRATSGTKAEGAVI